MEIRVAISVSESRFAATLSRIEKRLTQNLPAEIAESVEASKYFDSALWKTEKDLKRTMKAITIPPTLTDEARKKIADEWQNNIRLYIKDFSQAEIGSLRTDIQKTVFAGNRRESAVKAIQKSYGVSENKAKFLARQETSLLMSKYEQTRYEDAGIHEYGWECVAGSPAHPVRPQHKKLADESKAGKIFRWDDPPVTSEAGQPVRRNNPGQDYNCRCKARPKVRFTKTS